MNRGILSTIYVRGLKTSPQDLHAILSKSYAQEPFVHVLPFGEMPQTRHVRGSNMTFIGVATDRVEGRAIICSALDNLSKGASGQAVQNMNLMLGFPETLGLEQVALFPRRTVDLVARSGEGAAGAERLSVARSSIEKPGRARCAACRRIPPSARLRRSRPCP